MTRFADLNHATMPGYGDPETWNGRTPYGDPPDEDDDLDPEERWYALHDGWVS